MGRGTSAEFHVSNQEKFSLCSAVINVCVHIYVYIDKNKKGSLKCDYFFPCCKCISILDAACPWNCLCGCSFDSLFPFDHFCCLWKKQWCLYLQTWTINYFLLALNFCWCHNLNLKTSPSAFGCPITTNIYWSYSMLKGLAPVLPCALVSSKSHAPLHYEEASHVSSVHLICTP